ncbi:PHP domain-containing protein [Lachnoclostridium phytofermentans]|uniref:PHP domain-containing protein n=1 Tax=Lachnoclostridium phytofermentans TaxID=66219 RepID=UPI00049543D6|nr:PHP domain-containing protein [Lachnoclostridium phytofermentans]
MLSDLHNHSLFSDGINTCEELIEQAIALGLQRVGLVDHVWRRSEWVPSFIDSTNRLKEKYEGVIQIVTGLEAKALTCAGELDLNDKWREKVDYILGSIHRIPSGSNQFYSKHDQSLDKSKVYEDWLSTIQGLLRNDMVDIVAHPAAELIQYKIPLEEETIKLLCHLGKLSGKVFEVNVKYKVPIQAFLNQLIVQNIPLSIGSDSHSTAQQKLRLGDIIATHQSLALCNLI